MADHYHLVIKLYSDQADYRKAMPKLEAVYQTWQ